MSRPTGQSSSRLTLLGDMIRATIELGLARLRLKSRHARTLIAQSSEDKLTLDLVQAALVDRVAFVLPRVAARLPWRADCLVRALAAERWLARSGIATQLTLGVPKDKRPEFEAHAWLTAGDRIVTGGDVTDYVPLVKP